MVDYLPWQEVRQALVRRLEQGSQRRELVGSRLADKGARE